MPLMNNWIKKNGNHLIIIVLFFGICLVYFTPAFKGKTLGQSDVVGAQSTQKEIMDYRTKGETVLWTNQIFGGMPAFQIWAPYSANITTHIVNGINKTFPNPIGTVLILLLGTYFLFCVLKLNPWLAAAGAIAFSFSSYNIILLVAGHSNQVFAITFFPPILASILLTLRGRFLLGGIFTAFFMAMEIKANHIQMTYYFLLAIILLLAIEFYHAVKAANTKRFFRSIACLFIASLLALAVNASLMWSTFEYSKFSYRGKSNLTSNVSKPSNGLDRQYAYQYSQGIAECLTFLVPNASGGASGTDLLNKNSETTKVFLSKRLPEDQALNYARQISSIPGLSMYWGDKRPSTAGPYYFGATVCFLFIFGLLMVNNRIKWWLFGTVVLTMFLSFGKNWPYLSDLFFDYFPLYNKFRAVESILAVTGLCVPILAFLAVQETVATADKASTLKTLKMSFYITGGLTLFLILIPGLFLSFRGSDEVTGLNYLSQALNGDTELANAVAQAMFKDRKDLEFNDAVRSLIFISMTFGLVWAFIRQKIDTKILSIGLLALTLVDLWQIDKRYLTHSSFTEKQDALVSPREVDLVIAKDPDPNFRVYDATADVKIDIQNPFFHKSIGGYSAARMKRYDELIDNQFGGSVVNQSVLNMLNTKYIIMADSANKKFVIQQNQKACGNAWFVEDVKYVDNADSEMKGLTNFSAKTTALVDKSFETMVGEEPPKFDSLASIKLTSYNPDHLIYQSIASAAQIAVFSEIYYEKGWDMYIDNVKQPYFRADYLLRSAKIPSGKHMVEFKFYPKSYYFGEKISLVASIVLVLGLLALVYVEFKKKRAASY
jgi:hypothetical protein